MYTQKINDFDDNEKRMMSKLSFALPVFTNGMLAISLGLAAVVYSQIIRVNNFWTYIDRDYGAAVAMVNEAAGYMLYLACFGALLVIAAVALLFNKSFMASRMLNILLWAVPMVMILSVSVFCYIPIFNFAIKY